MTNFAHIPSLQIGFSRIHGQGVFAFKSIKKGAIVFVSSEYLATPNPLYGSVQRSKDEHLLEPRVFRWVNHSCHPNTEIWFDGNRILLITLRDIPSKSEIVCCYDQTEDYIPFPFVCNCGNCSGKVIK